ncbi:hypothetical protein R1sor_010459 [Riccia sorocarpa]|uniref:Endonuclease/exonuclease/phosphatase domain-containing protein n=1 Tax=Riccia sorocarpa TaxID=122646 RepID=A0ABD3HYE2_9MARC
MAGQLLSSSRGPDKENVGEGIPPLAKVLLMLESLSSSVIEIKSTVSTLSLVVSDIRRDVRFLYAREDPSKARKELETIKTEVHGIRLDRQALDRLDSLSSEVQDVRLKLGTSSESSGGFTEQIKSLEKLIRDSKVQTILPEVLQEVDSRGAHDVWASMDIVAVIESWETQKGARLEIPGFQRVVTLWNEKKMRKGRGFGGIAVFSKEGNTLDIRIECEDSKKQFVGLCFSEGVEEAFIFFAYFAPYGAPVYSEQGLGGDPFQELCKAVIKVKERGPVWLMGDFNSRVEDFQGCGDSSGSLWRQEEDADQWRRSSQDKGRNQFTENFTQFVNICGLTVINGVQKFPGTETCTCFTPNGASLVDYLLTTRTARDRISDFRLGPLLPESDHCPLVVELSGFGSLKRSKNKRPALHLDIRRKTQYQQVITSKLHSGMDSSSVTSSLLQAAKEVFGQEPRRKSWFDNTCQDARVKALSATEDRQTAFRVYKQFIRAKKRQFVQEQQKILAAELMRDPASFWSQLRPKRGDSVVVLWSVLEAK